MNYIPVVVVTMTIMMTMMIGMMTQIESYKLTNAILDTLPYRLSQERINAIRSIVSGEVVRTVKMPRRRRKNADLNKEI